MIIDWSLISSLAYWLFDWLIDFKTSVWDSLRSVVEANGLASCKVKKRQSPAGSPGKEEKKWREKERGKSKMNSSYVRKMAVLSAKIFGNLPRPVSERWVWLIVGEYIRLYVWKIMLCAEEIFSLATSKNWLATRAKCFINTFYFSLTDCCWWARKILNSNIVIRWVRFGE